MLLLQLPLRFNHAIYSHRPVKVSFLRVNPALAHPVSDSVGRARASTTYSELATSPVRRHVFILKSVRRLRMAFEIQSDRGV